MTLKQASRIISTIMQWQFVLQGIKEKSEVNELADLEKYSLSELLKANQLVSSNNSRKRKLQAYWQSKDIQIKGVSIQMTCADRLIAAVYTAIHYPPNGDLIAIVNDKGVGCVTVNYENHEN